MYRTKGTQGSIVMIWPDDENAEMIELFSAMTDGSLSEPQCHRLRAILTEASGLREFYFAFIEVDAMLAWEHGMVRPCADTTSDASITRLQITDAQEPSPPLARLPNLFSTTCPSDHLIGWSLAYLIATVILGIGAWVGSFTYVSYPDLIVEKPPRAAVSVTERDKPFVGRITGMSDCKLGESGEWRVESGENRHAANGTSHQPLATSHLVRLGDKFALRSGLMEITYDSGAKVILQGPVTYEVDSADGGYLAVGRLKARVEKGTEKVASGQWPVARTGESGEGRGVSGDGSLQPNSRVQLLTANPSSSPISQRERGPETNPQSLIPNPSHLSPLPSPLFTITTPTATITDLGTEFGVDVDKNGMCDVHVLSGLVEARFQKAAGHASPHTIRLKAGEGCRQEGPGGQLMTTVSDKSKFNSLRIPRRSDQRDRWLAYSRQLRSDPTLVAYYTFEKHAGSASVLPNQTATGTVLDARVRGTEWAFGRWSRKLALHFHGPNSGDEVILPEPQRFNFQGSFSVAVWFKVDKFTKEHQPLICRGDDGWRLQQCDSRTQLRFATNSSGGVVNRTDGQADVADGHWHLAVAVFAPDGKTASQRLYIDGRLDAETTAPPPLSQNNEPVRVGAIEGFEHRTFQGLIDEVAILSRAMSADEVETMFAAGNPATPLGERRGDAMKK